MILLWIATTGWCVAIIGLGRWCRPLLGRHARGAALSLSALLGVALAQTASICWNFLFPVSAVFASVLLALGFCGLTLPHRRYGPPLGGGHATLIASFAAAIVPWLSTRVHYQHDVGFYALPIVRWAHVSAVPLGMANLNPRMGFNSGWFLLDALLRRPLLPADTLPSLAPAVVITLVLTFAWPVLRQLPAGARVRGVALASLGIVLLLGSTTVVWGLNSPLGDLPVLIGWIVITMMLVDGAADSEAHAQVLLGVTLVAALTITTKLSALPLALVPVLLAWRTRVPFRPILVSCGLATLVILPWLVRGYWTTGCLLFPVPSTCLPHAWWSTPLPWVTQEAVNVINWAKEPYWSDHGLVRPDWLLPWMQRSVRSAEVLVPVVIASAAIVLGHGAVPASRRPFAQVLGAAMVAQLALVAMRAPDPRFAMGPLWVAAFVTAWIRMRDVPTRRFTVFMILCIGACVHALLPGWRDQTRGLRHAGESPALWLMPPKLDSTVPFAWVSIAGGRIRVAAPDMRPAPACWGLAPPCAPGLSSGLRMILTADGGRIRGFAIDSGSLPDPAP